MIFFWRSKGNSPVVISEQVTQDKFCYLSPSLRRFTEVGEAV